MQYPLVSEYIEAIRSAEDNFDQLINLRPILDDHGTPIMSGGNFAVVFKMKDIETNKHYAVKCFVKDQIKREERYAKISDELQYISSPYLLHVRYLERELFVSSKGCNEEEFPVLIMDWVEGLPLDVFLKKHLHNKYQREMLAYRFCKMGAWLLSQSFAHGDLKPDNILVRSDGSLILVDYDGMYVPSMEGETAVEIGSPDFRHPLRTEKDFNEHIDDFSIASIALSLKAIALDPKIYGQYATADRLLFSTNDYQDIGSSSVLQAIMRMTSDAELSTLASAFLLSLAKNSLSMVSFRVLLLNEPEKPIDLSTEITDEDKKYAIEDEFGAKYTADGLKLISIPDTLSSYTIKPGTMVIGDRAFYGCRSLLSINIPDSVISIGEGAFLYCGSLQSVNIPNSVTNIGNDAFRQCESLQTINIPDSVTSIGCGAFSGCRKLKHIVLTSPLFYISDNILFSKDGMVIFCWSNDTHIKLSDGVTSIGSGAFCNYSSLQSINIPDSVTSIGKGAFGNCYSLQSINIPNSVTSIGDATFFFCRSLQSINIPNSVTSIGDDAFLYCKSLQSVNIPNSVTNIGNDAFRQCESLQSINIPDSVTNIGGGAFNACCKLKYIALTSPVFYITGNILFSIDRKVISCWANDTHIKLSDGVTSIGKSAFWDCHSLQSINIPNSVTSIGDNAFCNCSSLQSINIPDSVTRIGNRAFTCCSSLQSINIPDSVTSIGDYTFYGCI